MTEVDSAADGDLLGAYPFLIRPAAAPPNPAPAGDPPFDVEDMAASRPGAGAGDPCGPPNPGDTRSDVTGSEVTGPGVPRPAGAPRSAGSAGPYDYEAAAAPGSPGAAPVGPVGWREARRRARRAAGAALVPERLELADALGGVLAVPLEALTDLPAFDTSAMDGWAVSGPGPWRTVGQVLAGDSAAQLADGTAVRIATGAQLPPGATAVLRREDGRIRGDRDGAELLHDCGPSPLDTGRDIRPRGQECRSGEPLLPPGTVVTPAVLGLAAAAGCDLLTVHRRPTVELLVLGDELLDSGLPRGGRIRDALGPLLPSWLRGYGARILAVRQVRDDIGLLREALRRSPADVVVTTGGTAAGPVDHLHRVLAELDAVLLVDGVTVRPGHPMLLAALPPAEDGARARHLVGLPGNPLAAVAGTVTLAEPLLRALAGFPAAAPYLVEAAVPLPWHPEDTRLVPVALPDRGAVPLAFDGPAMLRGLAVAEGLAVVPPGGVRAGSGVEVLELPTGAGA
ncbi:molybdopterin molybdotransferase MoeA [Streptacidiphilus sp. EB129]|uniref:molybdopterin molybdotransferase MoeA n=1 Tax=Streptacidiphilus sp. EB129 TaxID=3156262 RepID=UPI003510E7FA